MLRHTYVTTMLDAGVDLRDVTVDKGADRWVKRAS
jgi:site-specific recombinase XerC